MSNSFNTTIRKSIAACFCAMLLAHSACSSINTKSDYEKSRQFVRDGKIGDAIRALPDKEKGKFISIMEKTYLSLISGKADIDDLLEYSAKIDPQKIIYIKNNGPYLFALTPDGYIISEHELVWMNILLSWGLSMRGKFEEARQRAGNAESLLPESWSMDGMFDDPFIRTALAVTWTITGDWSKARIHFKAAEKLDNDLQWADALSQMKTQPRKLIFILGGIGYEPIW